MLGHMCPMFAAGTESKRAGADIGNLNQGTILRGLGCEIVFLFHFG